MMIVSGFSAAISSATVSYARIVFVICFSLPFPIWGTIIGGCGTIYAARIAIYFPPFSHVGKFFYVFFPVV